MSQIVAVVEALKRALKAKKLTYAQVARELKMSEASVKRMFSSNHFTLDRFEQICQIAGLGLTELAREVDSEKNYISHLTLDTGARQDQVGVLGVDLHSPSVKKRGGFGALIPLVG